MIVVFKKSDLCILAIAVFLSVMTATVAKKADIIPASAVAVSDRVIVLDAGHGAADGGAVGAGGTFEKELNLKISLKLLKLLEQTGAKVIMTRTDDEPLAETKREDMHIRKSIRDTSDADIFVSIHMNKFSQQKYSGAQVFYADDELSRALGESIQLSLKQLLNPENNRAAKKAEDSIFILKQAKVPSVIVECGFLSNPTEENLLNQPDYQDKVAWAVYSGIINFFESKDERK